MTSAAAHRIMLGSLFPHLRWLRGWLTLAGVSLGLSALLASPASAQTSITSPEFLSPYASTEPLESFLVFSAPPRENVPDGQIHWVDAEVPGIDVRGPDGRLRSMCAGSAWSLAGGDTVGGGGKFVAVECSGAAQGWQMLAFHLCAEEIHTSISASQRQYTLVSPGDVLATECPHTHLSLGYWAAPEEKRDLPCPQWYVQGRYWVNAICMVQSRHLPAILPDFLTREDDWELRVLTPELLEPLRSFAVGAILLGLTLYLFRAFFVPPAPRTKAARAGGPLAETLVKSGVGVLFIIMLMVASAGPVWPVGGRGRSGYTTADQPYQQMAQAVGYADWRLLKAFYTVAVPRDSQGRPVAADEAGKVFPPEAAAAIPFGETNAEAWGVIDPTQPGPYGRYIAWEAVAQRWPPSLYERVALGLTVSQTAQRQRDGLNALAASPAMQALGRQLGVEITAEALYGSSAGAVGRTQILPQYFAPGAMCGDMDSLDVWNDPMAVAECTTRYLTVSGCWGNWWANGDVWSALCGYNPGAWNVDQHAWYWNVLQDRMTRLAAASEQFAQGRGDAAVLVSSVEPGERYVPTPVLGLMLTEALLHNGQSAYGLPEPLPALLAALEPHVREPDRRAVVRGLYRVFRAWLLIYYSPQELLAFGVQL